MGRVRLQEELLATGCPEHIVHATLRATYRKVSERDLAMQVVTMAGRISSAQARGRVARLLSQRGFDEDTIETVMGPLMREGSYRTLKKSASGVLASFRGSTYRSVRLASCSLRPCWTAILSILCGVFLISQTCGLVKFRCAHRVFPLPIRII